MCTRKERERVDGTARYPRSTRQLCRVVACLGFGMHSGAFDVGSHRHACAVSTDRLWHHYDAAGHRLLLIGFFDLLNLLRDLK